MNPIVRMMKRYIKMPLKYALPLLFIGALVLSATTGCTDSTNPSATPTAAPTTAASTIAQTASSDPSLSTFVNLLNKANLTAVLDGKGNFTVFAPDNTAFSKVMLQRLQVGKVT